MSKVGSLGPCSLGEFELFSCREAVAGSCALRSRLSVLSRVVCALAVVAEAGSSAPCSSGGLKPFSRGDVFVDSWP